MISKLTGSNRLAGDAARFARRLHLSAPILLAAALASACQSKHDRSSQAIEVGLGSVTPAPAVLPKPEPLVGERVEIPGGAFRAGSRPGEAGRKPQLEPRLASVELGPFLIDRLAYPNDPARAPLTEVTRERASRLCAERGSRLCTELEWERACKGPLSTVFSTGQSWDPQCAGHPERCASGFDVLGMGSIREWTASNVVPSNDRAPHLAAVRGGPPTAPSTQHRCARRRGVDADETHGDLGFRCCKGPPNAAKVKEPREGQTFSKSTLNAAELEKLLARYPETQTIAKEVLFFREPEAADTVISRGPGDRKGFLFTVSPLRWNPVAGMEFLVVAARSGKNTSFVTVFFVVDDNEYELASSFVMKDEVGPVALAYNGYIRPRLHFSTCWGCPGETGKILYRDPDAALIVQP